MKIKDYFLNERESLLQQKSQQRIVATALKKTKKGIQLPQLTVEEKTEFNYYIQRVI